MKIFLRCHYSLLLLVATVIEAMPGSDLTQSVTGLESCIQSLETSIDTLDEALIDHDRLGRVLFSKRVFGLVPDVDLRDINSCFKAIVSPRVHQLVEKLDADARANGINVDSHISKKVLRLNSLKSERIRLSAELQLAGQINE